MTAHGTDPDTVDLETFHDICLMYSDGLIGNYGVLEVLGSLTAGVYNYMRSSNTPAYKLKDVIPKAYDYIYRPLSADEQQDKTQATLKGFVLMNAPKGVLKE